MPKEKPDYLLTLKNLASVFFFNLLATHYSVAAQERKSVHIKNHLIEKTVKDGT